MMWKAISLATHIAAFFLVKLHLVSYNSVYLGVAFNETRQ